MPSVVQHLCDSCFDNGEEVAGRPTPISLDGKERVLILCSPCEGALVTPLRALLDEYGQAPQPGATKTPKRRKRADGAEPEVPVTPVGEFACSAKGCKRTFDKAQGKAMHEYRAHGIRRSA